jgi:arylsulfatase A-like enzyme
MRWTLSAMLLLSSSAAGSAAETPKRPNILFVFSDDQSYKTVGCYPESWPWVRTPNIDALAKTGVRFHGAYLGAWCMPSRASLLTGKQPHGIQSMRMAGKYPGSTYDPKQCPFWPALFREGGYHTAQIGKWHTGTDAGFGRDWDYQIVWNRPKHPENAGAYYDRQRLAFNGEERWQESYPADNYTKWAREYILGANRDKSKPWFLWLCHGSVHGPSKPAARHKGKYKDAKVPEPADLLGPWPGKPDYLKNTLAWRKADDGRVVAGKSGEKVGDAAGGKGTSFANWVRQVNECVPAIDEGVGELIAALKASGQLDNTLVVYTADQGFAMGEHGMRMKIAPYDANYRSPLIVSMPGTVAAGKVCRQTPNAPDLIATFFAAAGLKPPADHHGRDLTPLLKDPGADWPHPCLYEHTGHDFGDDVAKVLKENPKEAIYQRVPWYTAAVHGGWKYVRYLQPGVPEELYDLRSDPEELTNLIGQPKHAAKLTHLREALAAELRRTKAPEPMIPSSPGAGAAKKPNVVVVLVDDFGWGDPSCYGNPMAKTPHMDRMAKEGVRFTQGYVASPICSPSRCGLLTGQFPARWKITSFLQTRAGNKACEMADFLDPKAPSLPRILKEGGYATAHVGKWHLGGGRDVTDAPKFSAYGYDLGLGTYESPEPASPLGRKTTPWGKDREPQQVARHDRTRWMVDQTLDFIKAGKGKPCFVNLWLDDTHTPFAPSDEQMKRVKGEGGKPEVARYKAVLTETDRQLGRLLDGLKGTNTLVLFLGDNGALPTFDQRRVAGLRGSKLSLYEGGVRVPFVAWWPGVTKAGVVNEKTVIASVDLLPSLAKLCGATLPTGYVADGEELSAAIMGDQPKRTKPLFWEYGRNDTSFRYPGAAKHRSPNVAIRDGGWKLLVNADGTRAELYEVAADPKETKNVAAEHPAVTRRLIDLALGWRKALP